jgi:hypothetical protein
MEGGQPSAKHSTHAPVASPDLSQQYLELYKLAVEMADRISARRAVANTFFLTINTSLAALLGSGSFRWYVSAAGIVFAGTWWALLRSYRELNSAKYQVILAMEERFPVRVYGDEWAILKRDPIRFALRRDTLRSWAAQYRELGRIERIVPWLFVAIYTIEIIRQITE